MKIEWSSAIGCSPEPQWFFTKGHVNQDEFLIELKKIATENPWGLPGDWLEHPDHFYIDKVSWEWWHFYPSRQKDMKGVYAQVAGSGRGNFPVTVYNAEFPIGDSEDVGLLLQADP